MLLSPIRICPRRRTSKGGSMTGRWQATLLGFSVGVLLTLACAWVPGAAITRDGFSARSRPAVLQAALARFAPRASVSTAGRP